jgi:hypothetical protein
MLAIYDERSLLHPALRDKSASYLVLRSAFPLRYFFPAYERINWYGDAVRSSGEAGMYMTDWQYEAWPAKRDQGDIAIGPF